MKDLGFSFFAVILSVPLFFGCATTYIRDTASTDRKQARQEAIQESIRKDFSESTRYINFGFGDEYIVKPPSFRPLDSLYNVRYSESQYGGLSRNRSKELDDQIAAVFKRVVGDTILFKYEIAHLFGVEDGDSIKFVSATYLLDANYEVEKVSIEFFFRDHKRFARQFAEFMRRESFMHSSYTPTQEENQFYAFFDSGLNSITTAVRKGNFISHILHVMRAASIQKTLNTETLIKQLIVSDITAQVIDYKSVKWSPVFTLVDENNNLEGYYVEHEWTYKNASGEEFTLLRRFNLDIYFIVSEILEVDEISD